MNTDASLTKCPGCNGYGNRYNTFSQLRRCGMCKGRKQVTQDVANRHHALQLFCEVKATMADRGLACDASSGLSLLRDREPHREAKMIESILNGRVCAVIEALAAYYREAYP